MDDVGEQTGTCQEFTAPGCFLPSGIGQIDIHPAGEQVLGVPFAFAVTQQN